MKQTKKHLLTAQNVEMILSASLQLEEMKVRERNIFPASQAAPLHQSDPRGYVHYKLCTETMSLSAADGRSSACITLPTKNN